ncbi:MAG: hypothetical protein PHI27_06670 [Eubacteriales bacterium]|nr:hypothetical protein [Eubacteriales bacterium]MDD4513757.1 hypothetical protein [Eubacteriales bacterium]
MVDVTTTTRELIVIRIQPQRNDPMFTRCLWMTVYIDAKAWRLMVDSDCGFYTHHWPNEDELHSFCSALASYLADESYILGKISTRSHFNAENTIGNIKEAYADDPDVLNDFLGNLQGAYTKSDFLRVLSDDNAPDDLYECFAYDYPPQALTAVKMLKEYVVPILRGENRGGLTESEDNQHDG